MSDLAGDSTWSLVSNTVLAIVAFIATTTVAVVGYLYNKVGGLGERVAALEVDKVSLAQHLEVWRAIEECKTRIASLPNAPPDWFKARVDQLETRLQRVDDAMAARLSSIEKAIAGLPCGQNCPSPTNHSRTA